MMIVIKMDSVKRISFKCLQLLDILSKLFPDIILLHHTAIRQHQIATAHEPDIPSQISKQQPPQNHHDYHQDHHHPHA